MQIIMTIFALIDWMVYGLVSEMFSLIFLIAEVDIFKDGALDALTNRVYGVLGVIILFKIVISAIQYLISPDKLSDKDKGMGGLLTRTIISIALLALVPTIFTFAKDAQGIISKAIPAIVIGREVNTDNPEDIKEAGNWMAFTTLSTFIQVKDDKKLDNDEGINDMNSFLSNITAGCGFFAPSECKYTYQFVFSIPVGIFMLYVLLSMGIDIAIRSIKLGILQLLAPIPIASYINNQENFKSWYTMCFKVYADLFIRLILIYFIVFVMGIIASGQVSFGDNAFVIIYMIVALLMFAKSAPKFISDVLGLKGDGMGGIADMFKPAWSRGGFAALGGMATAGVANAANRIGGAAGAASALWQKGGTANRLKAALKMGGGIVGGAISGAAGATSAGIHGGVAAFNGKNGKDVIAAGHKRAVTARQNRDLDKLNHVGTWDRVAARAQDYLGLDTAASLAEGKQKAYSTVHQDVGNYKKAVMGRITKEANVALRREVKAGGAISQLGKLMEDNHSAIMASGNVDLINFSNKFERTTIRNADGTVTGAWKLRDGVSLSYHDLSAINADAKQAGIGSIAGLTEENGALTLLAQKELFEDAMRNEVYTTTGELHKTINANSGRKDYVNNLTGVAGTTEISTHVDIATAVGTAKQHITENAVSLGTFTKDIVYTDKDGRKQVATTDKPVEGADMFISALTTDFGKLDDTLQRQSAELSSKMSGDKNAAARASMQRRDSNKKS